LCCRNRRENKNHLYQIYMSGVAVKSCHSCGAGPDLAFLDVSSTHAMEAMMENDEGHPLNGPFPTD
ncbi:MAG: hypothetical protein O3B08_05785, partial [Proteobacteria bacterium]|nr:hypothetical protein [Pseudomonadota bacterium]